MPVGTVAYFAATDALLVTQVVRCKFSPTSSSNEATKLQVHLALQAWHAQLDPSMQYDCNSNRTRYSLLLSLVYHWMLLLLHRPSVDDARHSPDRRDFSTQLAFYSANKISEHAGDISKYFKVTELPIYAYVIFFSLVPLPCSHSVYATE